MRISKQYPDLIISKVHNSESGALRPPLSGEGGDSGVGGGDEVVLADILLQNEQSGALLLQSLDCDDSFGTGRVARRLIYAFSTS